MGQHPDPGRAEARMGQSSEVPEEIRELYESLDSEVSFIHAKWKLYRQLFGTSKERIELLNRTAGYFFGVVQHSLFEDLVISLSRLTDPASSFRGKENRSLEQLVDQLALLGHEGLCDLLRADLRELGACCEPFRTWRNKRIAHSDLSTVLGIGEDPLPGLSRDTVETALAAARTFMNHFNEEFRGRHTAYEHVLLRSDGNQLIYMLERAVQSIEDEERVWSEALVQPERKDESSGCLPFWRK